MLARVPVASGLLSGGEWRRGGGAHYAFAPTRRHTRNRVASAHERDQLYRLEQHRKPKRNAKRSCGRHLQRGAIRDLRKM